MSEGKVQQKQQARRAEIVAAAQRCFAAKGLHGASVADIAREAGLSVGQLYRIFASKEAIIEAIVSEIVRNSNGTIRADNHQQGGAIMTLSWPEWRGNNDENK